MSVIISLCNDCVVGIFGSVLSAAFSDVFRTRRNCRIFQWFVVLILVLQGVIYSIWDAEVLRQIYPLIMHLPLMLLLYVLTKRLLWSVISVLSAYLCCQLRRWIALLLIAPFAGNSLQQDVAELMITLPIFVLLFRFVAPVIRQFACRPIKLQLQFGILPMVYYIFDYVTVVYTDFLTSGSPVVVEFMPFVCCVSYLVFLLYYSAEEQKQIQLKQIQNNLDLQLKQSVSEIRTLRESQELASRYRHDLRHHLQYVSACIQNSQEEEAQKYISAICKEIEAQKVKYYCENEAVNLILSSFAGRAEKAGIAMHICGTLPSFLPISDSDLCVLFSNALENAIHACMPFVAEGKAALIEVEFYEKEGTIFLQIINPYKSEIHFEKDRPISKQPEHGMGIQSICAIVERYGGGYSFLAKEGTFILRLHL